LLLRTIYLLLAGQSGSDSLIKLTSLQSEKPQTHLPNAYMHKTKSASNVPLFFSRILNNGFLSIYSIMLELVRKHSLYCFTLEWLTDLINSLGQLWRLQTTHARGRPFSFQVSTVGFTLLTGLGYWSSQWLI